MPGNVWSGAYTRPGVRLTALRPSRICTWPFQTKTIRSSSNHEISALTACGPGRRPRAVLVARAGARRHDPGCHEAAPAAPLKLSNKWRIEVHEGSNNTGTLLFRVTPDKGTATDVLVNIKKGRSENGVASDVKNTFKKVLDPKVYHIESDDGEDVLVKKRKGPDFEVKLVESTLKGTRVNLDKE